jgi:hypothetical protein
MNLAEQGLENALYCVNQNQNQSVALATAWTGWTTSGHDATKTFSGFTPAPGASGVVKVYAQNYDLSGIITLVSKATVSPGGNQPPLSKFIEVKLYKRSIYAGMIARNSFRGDSNTFLDSWNSDPANVGAFTPYSTGVSHAGGPVGVVTGTNGALNLGDNPIIYGTANTGGGTVTKTGSAVLSGTVGGSGWNASLVNTSFSYTWPPVTTPTPSATNTISTNITASTTFPRTGDVAASDGKYYYTFAAGKVVSFNGTQTLTVNQPVVFIMNNHTGVNAIYTSSSATFTYGSSGKFDLYTNGNIDFDSGANFFANKAPINTNIFGTSTTTQTFLTRGGGTYYGCIMAPNANVTFDSGVSIMGAMCVNTITLLGGCKFHYDEAINLANGGGYKVSQWKELKTAAERAAYATQLNF